MMFLASVFATGLFGCSVRDEAHGLETDDRLVPEVVVGPATEELADAKSAELLYVEGGVLYRYVEGAAEPEVVAKDWMFFSKGMNARMIREGSVLLVWGRHGLAWVNLETGRLERLIGDAVESDGVFMLGPDHVVIHTRAHELLAWSVPLGKRAKLAEGISKVAHATNESRLAWGTSTGVNVLGEDDIAGLFDGDAVSPKVILTGTNVTPVRAFALSPTGHRLAIVQNTVSELSGLVGPPITLLLVDPVTGEQKLRQTLEGEDVAVVSGVSWERGVGLRFETHCCDGCGGCPESRYPQKVDSKGRLSRAEGLPAMPTWAAEQKLGEFEVRPINGQPQVFSSAEPSQQLTDIPRVDKPFGWNAGCEVQTRTAGVALAPWPDGEHAFVASIDRLCIGGGDSSVYEVASRLFLASREGGQRAQIALDADIGGWALPDAFDARAGFPLDASVNGFIDWTKLENWSPNGHLLLTPAGELITRQGELVEAKLPHVWAAWRR